MRGTEHIPAGLHFQCDCSSSQGHRKLTRACQYGSNRIYRAMFPLFFKLSSFYLYFFCYCLCRLEVASSILFLFLLQASWDRSMLLLNSAFELIRSSIKFTFPWFVSYSFWGGVDTSSGLIKVLLVSLTLPKYPKTEWTAKSFVYLNDNSSVLGEVALTSRGRQVRQGRTQNLRKLKNRKRTKPVAIFIPLSYKIWRALETLLVIWKRYEMH